jgi:Phosphoribosyl-AMP cyclohydrolase
VDERRIAFAHARARRDGVLEPQRRSYGDKGATSGNVQKLVELRYDCDADTLLALVHPAGPACHTGERTCFYRAFPR